MAAPGDTRPTTITRCPVCAAELGHRPEPLACPWCALRCDSTAQTNAHQEWPRFQPSFAPGSEVWEGDEAIVESSKHGPMAQADGITLWGTLSEAQEPLALLTQVAHRLRTKGRLLGSVASLNCDQGRIRYSVRALRRALLRAGLVPLFVGSQRDYEASFASRLSKLLQTAGSASSYLLFEAEKPAGVAPLAARSFVRYRSDAAIPASVKLERPLVVGDTIDTSIIIPTSDGTRDGYLPALLEQLRQQDFRNFEVLVVVGDNRQGRAINTAAALAQGEILITLDDDTRLSDRTVLQKLVTAMRENPDVGMAGGANLIPDDAPPLVKRVMRELPRRSSPPVSAVTDSDMAEHPLLAMRKDAFYAVGGENELIPRGLDPYLREQFRQQGYRVVVVPGVTYHHLPPARLGTLVRQFFRNGAQSRYCSQLYPEWVYETLESHADSPPERPSLARRAGRQLLQLGTALLRGHVVFILCRTAYALGWLKQTWKGL